MARAWIPGTSGGRGDWGAWGMGLGAWGMGHGTWGNTVPVLSAAKDLLPHPQIPSS